MCNIIFIIIFLHAVQTYMYGAENDSTVFLLQESSEVEKTT